MSKLLDVSKYNYLPLFILSLPLIVLAWVMWGLFVAVAFTAMIVGRKRAMNALYKTKELL